MNFIQISINLANHGDNWLWLKKSFETPAF